jgi:oligopeptide transport system substrate-binding protein
MKINKLLYALSLSSLLMLGACSKKDGSVSMDNTLRVDVGTELPTFDPVLAEDGNTYRVINDLFAGLVDFDQSNRPIPGMAKNWEISSDGKIYTFHLRDNLKFSDGSPITADDFVFSWRRLVDPKTGSSYAFLLKDVLNGQKIIDGKEKPERLGVIALDPKTVVVHLEHPTNAFLSYITTPNVFVVPRKVVEKYGQDWTKPENMVTSGAYILKEHVVNGYILATKNPNYYEESTVKIANVKYFPFTDTNASLSNFKTGALDTTWQNVPIDQYQQLKKQFPEELHTFKWERMDYLNLNFQLPKFANNLKLRQALAMAINREDLTEKILGAGQSPLYSVVTPTIENGKYSSLNYSWSKLPRDKQIQMAKELYKEAGYGPNNPLTLTIKYQTNDLYKKVMISVMSMWQETLGVKVKLVNEEMKVLFPELKNGNYEVAQGRWGADYNSVTTYTPLFICNNGNNRSHYCNKEYDTIIAQAEATSNPAQQEKLYKQALQIAMNDYAIIPLYEPTHQRLVTKRVKGYDIDSNYLDNVQTKWMTLDIQR